VRCPFFADQPVSVTVERSGPGNATVSGYLWGGALSNQRLAVAGTGFKGPVDLFDIVELVTPTPDGEALGT
jgi:hypothetical protein